MVRAPDEISISGKVLSMLKVLAVEDENGKLHSIDNSSGQTWEGVSLGGMVNLTYSGNTVTAMEQTAQGADKVGAYMEALFYYHSYTEPFGQWIDIGDTIYYYDLSGAYILSEAEKAAFFVRVKEAYAVPPEIREGTWDDLLADGEANGETLIHRTDEPIFSYYENRYWNGLSLYDGGTEEAFQPLINGRMNADGFYANLNPATGQYTITMGIGVG